MLSSLFFQEYKTTELLYSEIRTLVYRAIRQQDSLPVVIKLLASSYPSFNELLQFRNQYIITKNLDIAGIIHLQLYQESFPNPDNSITKHAQEVDLNYTLEDLPKMLDNMAMACNRLINISNSLRTFSRGDQNYKVLFNIHDGIDSTILILKHRLKANEQHPAIDVVIEYGNLPLIECFPGQLNQVFMNILANAIDALEEFNTGRSFEDIKANPNRIIIKTSIENNQIKITITNNGKGIEKIFKNKYLTIYLLLNQLEKIRY